MGEEGSYALLHLLHVSFGIDSSHKSFSLLPRGQVGPHSSIAFIAILSSAQGKVPSGPLRFLPSLQLSVGLMVHASIWPGLPGCVVFEANEMDQQDASQGLDLTSA